MRDERSRERLMAARKYEIDFAFAGGMVVAAAGFLQIRDAANDDDGE